MQDLRAERSVSPLALLGLVAGMAAALVAQFALDGLADRGDFFHQLQHGLLFAGGVSLGAAVLSIHRSGQRAA